MAEHTPAFTCSLKLLQRLGLLDLDPDLHWDDLDL